LKLGEVTAVRCTGLRTFIWSVYRSRGRCGSGVAEIWIINCSAQ